METRKWITVEGNLGGRGKNISGLGGGRESKVVIEYGH